MRIGFLALILFLAWGCAGPHFTGGGDAVYLYLKKPQAKSVFVLHSGDGYRYHEAEKIDGRTWRVKLPLKEGFKYFFIVDGEPFVPDCRYRESDDFGSINCVHAPAL